MNSSIAKHRPLVVFSTLSCCIILSGCTDQIPCSGFNPKDVSQSTLAAGTINIAIDGSGSMKGFANINDSQYQAVLEELDTALGISSALGFSQSKTIVSRIGREGNPHNRISRITVGSLLAARKPDFFDAKAGAWPKVSSTIDQFVSKDRYSVDILISDLEPDDASIKQLISAIIPKLGNNGDRVGILPWKKSTYIGNELAIIGIKSQFSGGVFPSVQGDFKSYPYTGLRPLYVVALGPVDKVEKIVERLQNNKSISSDMRVSRFAANPSSGKTVFINPSQSALFPPNCLSPAFSLSQGLSGKLRIQDPTRWLLAQKIRGCSANQIGLRLATDPIPELNSIIGINKSLFNSATSDLRSASLTSKGVVLETQFLSIPGAINTININADAAKLDQLTWSDWSTSGTRTNGSKTQRLLSLIQSIRGETNQYAEKAYGARYSPIRMCAAVKT